MPIRRNRVFHATVQQLESLKRAGVTHVLRIRRPVVSGKPAEPQNIASESLSAALASQLPGKGAPPRPATTPPRPAVQPPAQAPTEKATSALAATPLRSVPEPADRAAALAEVAARVVKCTRCAELARTRTQTVFGVGNPRARLVFLGEAPGADEDRLGEPFVGDAGKLLDKIIAACTLRREEVYILNILRCRPPGNRTPLPDEAENCREYLEAQLEIIKPEFICCLGTVAAQNLLRTTTPIGKLRGNFFDYRGAKVLCTYHPAYLLRNPAAKAPVWEDMKKLMAAMGIPVPGK